MNKFNAVSVLLAINGIAAIFIGGALLVSPVAFESSAGIPLSNNASLLSEIRAYGGNLLAAGLCMMAGAFVNRLTYMAVFLSALFYLSYGASRIISILLDGMPSESLVMAMIAELVLGAISCILLIRLQKTAN